MWLCTSSPACRKISISSNLQKPRCFQWRSSASRTTDHESAVLVQTPLQASVVHEGHACFVFSSPWRSFHDLYVLEESVILISCQRAPLTLCRVRLKCFILVGTSARMLYGPQRTRIRRMCAAFLLPAIYFARLVNVTGSCPASLLQTHDFYPFLSVWEWEATKYYRAVISLSVYACSFILTSTNAS